MLLQMGITKNEVIYTVYNRYKTYINTLQHEMIKSISIRPVFLRESSVVLLLQVMHKQCLSMGSKRLVAQKTVLRECSVLTLRLFFLSRESRLSGVYLPYIAYTAHLRPYSLEYA